MLVWWRKLVFGVGRRVACEIDPLAYMIHSLIMYVMRYFRIKFYRDPIIEPCQSDQFFRSPLRVQVRLANQANIQYVHLEEHALAICMLLHLTRDAPYKTFCLTDDSGFFVDPRMPPEDLPSCDRKTWELHGIAPCGRCTGVSQFLALSIQIIKHWESMWEMTINHVTGHLDGGEIVWLSHSSPN